jgi:uncharacterized membrane protein
MVSSANAYPSNRYAAVDALRGLAMLWMTVFHFCFDLTQQGFIQQNFYRDPFWTWQRSMIVSLFLFCAGLGQAMALAQGQSWQRFWRRWAQVLVCALLVTAGSWWMFPRSFIYFGVLHGMVAMLLLARLTATWGNWLWPLGAAALALPSLANTVLQSAGLTALAEALNTPQINWVGLITRKPITEDYVPLLPWLGVMWWGVAAGQLLLRRRSCWLTRPLPQQLRPLAVLGRWSLSYYMLHQPVLIGVLLALGWLSR